MAESRQRDVYRSAFELAQSHFAQLNSELAALDQRRRFLVNAASALESVIKQRPEQQPAPSEHVVIVATSKSLDRPSTESKQAHVHRKKSPNGIRGRIDHAMAG